MLARQAPRQGLPTPASDRMGPPKPRYRLRRPHSVSRTPDVVRLDAVDPRSTTLRPCRQASTERGARADGSAPRSAARVLERTEAPRQAAGASDSHVAIPRRVAGDCRVPAALDRAASRRGERRDLAGLDARGIQSATLGGPPWPLAADADHINEVCRRLHADESFEDLLSQLRLAHARLMRAARSTPDLETPCFRRPNGETVTVRQRLEVLARHWTEHVHALREAASKL